MINIRVPCSPEQEDVIADHAIMGSALGVLPDERQWMLAQAQQQSPGCKIVAADLDIENAMWELTVDVTP